MDKLKELLGPPITYSPIVGRITGSINSAIFLSQLMYWWERKSNGLLYKTVNEIEKETALTRYQQEVAVKKLVDLDFIELYMMGLPRKRHFGINFNNIKKALCDYSTNKQAENQPTSEGETNQQESGKSTNKFGENQLNSTGKNPELERGKTTQQYEEKPRTYTKNTTKTTTENTTKITTENTSNICGEKKSPQKAEHFFSNLKKKKKENNPPNLRATPLDKTCLTDGQENQDEKPKNSQKGFTGRMKKAYLEFYRNKTGLPYYWTGKDGKHLSELVKKIYFMFQEMQKIPDDDSVLSNFQMLLENIKDSWILQNLSVAIINSKFNEIVSNIKNGHNEQNSKTGRFSISPEYERSIYQRLHGIPMQ